MIRLQCENCFADVLPCEVLYRDKTLFQCQGCHTYYLYDGKLVKTIPPWKPEGYVENPQGEWVSYFLYCWRDLKPPYVQHLGFKSANYEKEVELEIPPELMKYPMNFQSRMIPKVIQAIKEVLPPGFNKYEADISPILRELF